MLRSENPSQRHFFFLEVLPTCIALQTIFPFFHSALHFGGRATVGIFDLDRCGFLRQDMAHFATHACFRPIATPPPLLNASRGCFPLCVCAIGGQTQNLSFRSLFSIDFLPHLLLLWIAPLALSQRRTYPLPGQAALYQGHGLLPDASRWRTTDDCTIMREEGTWRWDGKIAHQWLHQRWYEWCSCYRDRRQI